MFWQSVRSRREPIYRAHIYVFATHSQSVGTHLAIRQQHYRKPLAAVGSRFIVPAYMNVPTKWGTEMRIWWNGYVYLMMLGYGRDESAPTPDGVFVPHFVGERWYFTECLLVSCGVFCVYFVGVRGFFTVCSPRYRRPSAAVGADLSCPRIRIHPRNGERKCVFGEMDMCIWWREYTYLVM